MLLQFAMHLTLALTPPTATHDAFADRLDHAEVTLSDRDAQVVAYDDHDRVIATLSTWVDEHGLLWISSDFEDGHSLISMTLDGSDVRHSEDLPLEVLAERAELIQLAIDVESLPAEKKHSWLKCGFYVGVSVAGCASANPVGCVGGGIKAACACVPMLVKEFREYECPILG